MANWKRNINGSYEIQFDGDQAVVAQFLNGSTSGYVNPRIAAEFDTQFKKDYSYTNKTHQKRKISLAFSICVAVILVLLIVSIILTLTKVELFDGFWLIWTGDLFKGDYGLYILLGASIIALISMIVVSIKCFTKIKHIICIVITIVFIGAGIGSGSFYYAQRVSEDTKIAIEMEEWLENFNGLGSESNRNELVNWEMQYDELLQSVKSKITNQNKLRSIKKAYNVYLQIEDIGEVTLEKKSEIDQARMAYDSLSDEEKSWVSNGTVLSQAISRYEYLSHVTYTIRFHPNGGTGTMEDIVCKYGESIKLPKGDYSIYGYYILGWSTSNDILDKADFDDEQIVSNLSDIDGDIIDLYAVWGGVQSTIHLQAHASNYQGSYYWSGGADTVVVTYGESHYLSFPYTMFEYKDWYVTGWYTSSGVLVYSGKSGIVSGIPGITSDDGKWILTQDITLYAHWTK